MLRPYGLVSQSRRAAGGFELVNGFVGSNVASDGGLLAFRVLDGNRLALANVKWLMLPISTTVMLGLCQLTAHGLL